MIKSFAHRGLKRFFETGTTAGINAQHTDKISVQLGTLNEAKVISDMAVPGWNLHQLKGDLSGHWSVKVSGAWRITFRFEGGDAEVVDYVQYH